VRPGVSTLDLLGPGYTLLTGPDFSHWRHRDPAELNGRVPLDIHAVNEAAAATLGIGRHGAVLLLPDGNPVAGWPELGRRPASQGRKLRTKQLCRIDASIDHLNDVVILGQKTVRAVEITPEWDGPNQQGAG
jgi:hypothetical protein